MNLLIENIRSLLLVEKDNRKFVAGKDMADLPSIDNAWLYVADGLIKDFGSMQSQGGTTAYRNTGSANLIDASGRLVMPAFCDSHTHLVYAGSREMEYRDKIMGLSYEQIAARGGGILNSVNLLRNTSENHLYDQSMTRIREIINQGTGALEIKSGYGLTTRDELKMLRVIRKIRETAPLSVKATFLGAHTIPVEYKTNPESYVDLVIDEMIPAIAAEKLADYIDVFCEKGFFTPEQTGRILEAGWKYGLPPKIHANELDFSGGIQAGVRHRALSVDHLEYTGDEEIELLRHSGVMPTLLPGASFFLGLKDPPARKMIDAGLAVALASDYNPGSSPSVNMKLMLSLACIRLKMLPAEAIQAATLNGARAMGLEKTHGSICKGKVANLLITKMIPNYDFLPYAYGSDLVDKVILKGEVQ